MLDINQSHRHIKDLHKFCVVESPDNSWRSQFDISRIILPDYTVLNSVESEGPFTVFMR